MKVNMKITVFWDVMLYSLEKGNNVSHESPASIFRVEQSSDFLKPQCVFGFDLINDAPSNIQQNVMVRHETVQSKQLYFFSCLPKKLGVREICGSGTKSF
jgi:hypothetical protein